MIRSIKVLGLGMLAALSMSAAAVPAASANPFFHSEFAGIFLTGGQTGMVANTLTTDLGAMKCNVARFDGSQGPMTTTTMTLKPTYEQCKVGMQIALVTLNGCRYTFHLEEQEAPVEARMGIECQWEKKSKSTPRNARSRFRPRRRSKKSHSQMRGKGRHAAWWLT